MRFAKAVASIGQALMVMGYDEEQALAVIDRLSRDSVLPLRVSVLKWLAGRGVVKTTDVATALDLPSSTATQKLEDLTMLGLVARGKEGEAVNAPNTWELRESPPWFTSNVGPVRERHLDQPLNTPTTP